ncbi:preprotein translocase subunit SecG [Limosilactobacillus mucosae]|uniref:preprotein translocase subunit SecG n=1 Tax=Limosilactobacillus mucosae TaxID=97478 RepID=UPI0039919AC7
MIVAASKSKSKWYAALMIMVLAVVLAGCQIKPVLSKKTLNDYFNADTQVLVNAREIADQKMSQAKDNNRIMLNQKERKVIKKDRARVAEIQQKLSKAKMISDYPKSVQAYTQNVDRYLLLLESGSPKKALKQQFHKTSLIGTKIIAKHNNGKFTKTFRIVLAGDKLSGYKLTSKAYQNAGLSIKKNNKQKGKENASSVKSARLLPAKNKNDMAQQKKKTAQYQHRPAVRILEGMASFSAVMVILVVFLQPSKQDDSMSALADNSGATLFTRPKPRGYTLFLLRSTEFWLLVMVGALIYLELLAKPR